MPDGKAPVTHARMRVKKSNFRQTTPGQETPGRELRHRETTSPLLHQPSSTTPELGSPGEGHGRRLHRAGLFEAEPSVQELLGAWDAADPFKMLSDREAMARVLIAAYPEADLVAESRKIIAWWYANPSKRKTKRGLKRFLNAWFSRASTPGGRALPSAPQKRAVSYDAADLWGEDDNAGR